MSRRPLDVGGKTFGLLTAKHRAGSHLKLGALWKCVCACGNELIVSAGMLERGSRTSCGCRRTQFSCGPKPRIITAHGRTQSIVDWSRELGVARSVLNRRLRQGMTPDEAMVYRAVDKARAEMWEGARDKPYAEDPLAQAIVEEWGACTSEEIGEIMGLATQRVHQIEQQATRKLAKVLCRGGKDIKAMLRLLDEMRTERVLPANGHEGEAA